LAPRELKGATRLPSRAFYARPTREVARDLLGAALCHKADGDLLAGRTVEVEAYLGSGDPAAHSSAGITPRTRVIFGPPGHAYVYRVYGIHVCLNVVAEPEGCPGCVLVRAIEPLCGIAAMRSRRAAKPVAQVANGPGKLTAALGIGLRAYGSDLLEGPLTIRIPRTVAPFRVEASPRIGITKATKRPLRYFIAGSPYVSR